MNSSFTTIEFSISRCTLNLDYFIVSFHVVSHLKKYWFNVCRLTAIVVVDLVRRFLTGGPCSPKGSVERVLRVHGGHKSKLLYN